MKTPQEKYHGDPQYRMLVDTLRHFIQKAEMTPSEIREAATLACIHHEMYSVSRYQSVPMQVNDALKILDDFRKTGSENNKMCFGCGFKKSKCQCSEQPEQKR